MMFLTRVAFVNAMNGKIRLYQFIILELDRKITKEIYYYI